MKNKLMKTISFSISCLILSLLISSGTINPIPSPTDNNPNTVISTMGEEPPTH